ncbi:probable G-protein coupled receptor 158 [Haliotis rubra]|uniref:probable G-protein coupled receptor 158 n=1 Tax=Haliotis rubra TaxID=36100 RepID=UPI001EE51619|nr:probable G-protein coupled receptor 158 [Haliotis rubra]
MVVDVVHIAVWAVYACVQFLLLTSARVAPDLPKIGSSSYRQVPHYENYRFPEDFKRSLRSQGEITYSTLPSATPGDHHSVPTATEVLEYIDDVQRVNEWCANKKEKYNPVEKYVFPAKSFSKPFREQMKKAVALSNTLNAYFMYPDVKNSQLNEDIYFALTQSVVENDNKLIGCGIAFDKGQNPSNSTQFFPYTYKPGKQTNKVVASDLGKNYLYSTTSWFGTLKRKKTQSKRTTDFIFAEKSDVGKYKIYDYRRNFTVKVSENDGFLGKPYFDCKLQRWVIQYSVPFYQTFDNDSPTFKGAVLFDIDLLSLEINQCANDDSLFANTHTCRPPTAKCVHIPGNGLRWASYRCECSQEACDQIDENDKNLDGKLMEKTYLFRNVSDNHTQDQCLPCIAVYNILLRGIPLGIQSFCMTIALVIGIVIVRLRKTKVMRSSMWILLEMILVGALLLYATVVIQYFEPTTLTCIMVPWFRECGFAIVYGALVLKVYRILAEFQSRKAHRVHVRDKDLLKYLTVIIIVVIGYMAAWTAVNVDHLSENATLLAVGKTEDQLTYTMCKSHWWDYVIELSEFLFLCFGVYLCYCVRSAPSDYSERRCISVAICYEAFFSTIFYILKHLWWYTLHPDYMFLMSFLRCQLTVTVVLLLILGPKLWYAHRPLDDDHMRNRAYSQSDVQDSIAPETMKLNVGISSNGDVDVGEISLAEMDPEDIRAELKRLYTQLQIYKTKAMRKDNPHISKRRGGRKQTHRRFSLQAFHHKHRHHHDHSEHEHEMSKTPEESTNSAEAMALTMEERSRGEDSHEGRSGPSVSFKPGHK